MVARQDLEYRRPLDFRPEPYEVGTFISAVGSRSFTLEAEIRDPRPGPSSRPRARSLSV